jgi:CelD/BcsL family acetyltransferase involved in cellulose biosynthesis
LRLETIHPKEIGDAEAALWRAHQAARPELGSPYLTPEWARIIGDARDDACVCVIEGGEGFLGVQRLSRFSAMGLGAPLADYQGLVGRRNIEIRAEKLCDALKVGRIDFTHVPAGQTLFAVAGVEGSWIAETADGHAAYETGLKQRRSEFARQTEKKLRKLAREHGETEFSAGAFSRADFDTLVSWKNAQLKRSGQPEIWARPWVRQTLNACFEARMDTFGGELFTLRAGGRLVAAAFGLRSPRVLHLWLIAHDSAFDAFSPGVQLTRWLIGWAADRGLSEVDFGPGDYQYKRQLASTQRMLERGVASRLSLSGMVRSAEHALRAGIERLPQPKLAALPGKAMRRLDLMRALAA